MATEKRLIDKQTAVKLLRGKCVAKYPSTFLMGLLASATEIEQLPEVDAVEVVHGEWVQIGYDKAMDRISCSVCKEYWNIIDNCTGTFNYCPNCGAKMDGGTNETD